MAAVAPLAIVAQAAGSIFKGVSERNAAYRAAGDDYENARLSILGGEQEITGILDDERNQAGASLAAAGSVGGSITTLIQQSAFNAEKHAAAVRQQAFGQAENYNAQGDESIRAGKAALISGMFNAVSGAVQGVSDMRQRRRLGAQGQRERNVRTGG